MKRLSDLVHSPLAPTLIDQTPVSGLCYVVCSDRRHKHAVLCQLSSFVYLNTTFNIPPHTPPETVHFTSLETLIEYLKGYTTHDVVRGIVIDDLSSFYWHLKSQNNLTMYSLFLQTVKNLQKRLRIPIIIFAWNISFDNGFNGGHKDTEMSYIPLDLTQLDHILYKVK